MWLSFAHPSRSGRPIRWRAIAAAPRAPGASVGDSSSTVASPRAASTSGEAAHSRAMLRPDGFEKGGSGRGHAAADDDSPDAERQGERSNRPGQVGGDPVDDLDRDLVAGRLARKTSAALACGAEDGACDRQPSPRRPGERSPDRPRSSRGSRAVRTRRRRHPDRRRRGPPRRQSCCRRGAAPRRGRRRPRCPSRSPGRRRSPAPAPTRRPPARSARAPPRGRRARRRPGPPAPPAASVPAAGG